MYWDKIGHSVTSTTLFACGINKSRFAFAVWKLLGRDRHHPMDLEPSFGFTKVSNKLANERWLSSLLPLWHMSSD